MSSLYKLSIQGIRSFDPNHSEAIQFDRPLTLIVGQNGSGKTTIIECLRYATTGDLPPNSKNGAFINDPELNGERDTKAQIKLAFNNLNGKSMILTKTLQAIKKPGASPTMKTLENQLVVINGKERTTISSKISDIDAKIPIQLGISKAILNYVVFCHQDDSLWPISEPAVLKKKFDEIFDSVKFIKVLDSLKIVNKEMNIDIKLLNNNVQHLKNDRTRAHTKLQEIDDLTNQIEENKIQIESITKELKQINIESDNLFKSNQDFEKVLSRIELLKQQRNSLIQQIERLENSTKLLSMSDEELKENLSNFANDIIKNENELQILKKNLNLKQDKISKIRSELSESKIIEGRLNTLTDQYNNNINIRKNFIEEYKSNLPKNRGDDIVESFKQYLTEKIENDRFNLAKNKEILKKKDSEFKDKLNKIRDEISKDEQNSIYVKKDIDVLKNKTNQLNKNLLNIRSNESKLQIEKLELEKNKLNLTELKKNFKLNEIESEINEYESKIFKSENLIEKFTEKINIYSKQSEIMARLKVCEENKLKTTSILNATINENKMNIDKFISNSSSNTEFFDTIENDWNLRYNEIFEKNNRLNKDLKSTEKEKFKIENNLNNLSNELNENKNSVKNLKLKIENVLQDTPISEYNELLKNYENDYHVELENSKLHKATMDFNKKAIEIANSSKKCLLCRRGFEHEDDLGLFIEHLQKQSNLLINKNIEEELESIKNDLNEIKSVENDVKLYNKLTQETLPNLNQNIESLNDANDMIKSEFNNIEDQFNDSKEELNLIESLKVKINEILRLKEETDEFDIEIKRIKNEISSFLSNDSTQKGGQGDNNNDELLNINELQENQNNEKNNLKILRNQLNQLIKDRDNKSKEIINFEILIKDKELLIIGLEKQNMDKINFEKTIIENNQKIEEFSITLNKNEENLKIFNETKKNLEDEYEEFKDDIELTINSIIDDINKFEKINNEFIKINQSIENYESNELNNISKIKDKISKFDNELNQLVNELNEEEVKIRELELELSDVNSKERNLRSNIDLRNLEVEKIEIINEIKELELENANSKREEYLNKSQILFNKQSNLKSKHSLKLGEINQLDRQIKSIQHELNRDYNNVDNKYLEEFAKLQSKLIMSNDITTYFKALDNAVMKYHSTKMKDINRIIDELWKRTYAGSDVDTVMIKSEPNITKSATSSKKLSSSSLNSATGGGSASSITRSYNYRVVMVKEGVELDMRGRCSAGQRVLVSIIIRLALAECFGTNFGMITLDEPTTNLDDDNIESLARALSSIISLRKFQRNFQLIVITHDEKFLRYMNAIQFTDHYYRIKRDERQKSEINRVNITSISR
ncbi:hypothetical protein B5S27_g4857 [[Candida] boidinii]|nr:hypothetical protein B5S27_g4857 [[Candida] boidinii]